MASGKMASASTTTNTEVPRQSSICSLSTFISDLHNPRHLSDDHGEASSMDDLLNTIYSDDPPAPSSASADDVWSRIISGEPDRALDDGGAMTLEDFLTKSGAVREEDVRVPAQFQGGPVVAYDGGGAAAGGRGKRRAVVEPLDKATQQKQRRMIKNRESAARSRERKQAYTFELESLVTQLEEENARLLREEAQRNQERYKQLMKNLIPVVESKERKMAERLNLEKKMKVEKVETIPEAEKKTTRVVLRRVSSMEW